MAFGLGNILKIASIATPFIAPSLPSLSGVSDLGGTPSEWLPSEFADFSSMGSSLAPDSFSSGLGGLGSSLADLAAGAEYGDPSASFGALGSLGQSLGQIGSGALSGVSSIPGWALQSGTNFALQALLRGMMPQPSAMPMPPAGYGAPTPQGNYMQQMALRNRQQRGQEEPGAVVPWNVLEGYGLNPRQFLG